MEVDNEYLSSIESRQRRERKEHQSQVQAMKKLAKNDKTKKKELLAEIAKLEAELESRHSKELEDAKLHSEVKPQEEETEQNDDKETIKSKVSKAQRRRDKKSLQEKAREEEIKIMAKENKDGPRNVENVLINKKLKEKNLQSIPVAADGDCLYKAVCNQLVLVKKQVMSVQDLRTKVSEYIRNNKVDFIPFMYNPDTTEMLTDEEFSEYCDKISDTKAWGGQLELRAISQTLKTPIHVIQAEGPDCIQQDTGFEGPPLIITYHRHMYSLGEHYNSTKLADEESEPNGSLE